MTSFTITCPPTTWDATKVTQYTYTANWTDQDAIDGTFPSGTSRESVAYTFQTDTDSNVFSSINNSWYTQRFFPEDPGGGNEEFWVVIISSSCDNTTIQSWSGERTEAINETYGVTGPEGDENNGQTNTTIVWTSFQDTSSQTTTTQTETVYQTTSKHTTNVSTLSATTFQGEGMTSPEPRLTPTVTQVFTTRLADFSTTRITTTTQQDTFAKWRTGENGATHRGTFDSATVVFLETSNLRVRAEGNENKKIRPELAWIVTKRPDFTETSTAIIEQQQTSQFTVFPSLALTAGHVEQATIDSEGTPTFSTSYEVDETETTYTTTAQAQTTISAVFDFIFTELPSPTFELVAGPNATTITTAEWYSTIRRERYTGGDTSTTTVLSGTTHEGRIGTVTWNASHVRSTTITTANAQIATAYTQTASFAGVLTLGWAFVNTAAYVNYGLTETNTVTFNRPIQICAKLHAPYCTQNQCGSSLFWAVAAASNVTSAAQQIGAVGVSVKFPSKVNVARTAVAPLGSWSYVTAGTTISASAGPASLSVTSSYGPTSAITTESTEGAWTLSGAAISRANRDLDHRINMGGTPPTGTVTAFYDAGLFSTSDANGSGTIEVTEAYTETVEHNDDRTAYLPLTGAFISQQTVFDIGGSPVFEYGERYNTTARNLADIIPETALITDRGNLIL